MEINFDLSEIYKESQLCNIIYGDINSSMLNHAYLLYGEDNVLLQNFASLMAQNIFCDTKNNCNTCLACKKVKSNSHSDLIIYPINSVVNAGIRVEDANNIITESYVYPLESNHKIFIINNFDKATLSSQNKLLKTIEEPSSSVIFIITTTNLSSIASTIKSRCKTIYINQASYDNVLNVMGNMQLGLSKNSVKDLVDNSSNNFTNIYNNILSKKNINYNSIALGVLLDLKRSSEVVKWTNDITKINDNIQPFLLALTNVFDDVVLYMNNHSTNISDKDYVEKIKNVSALLNIYCVRELLDEINYINDSLNYNVNKVAGLERLLFKILEVKYKCQ